MGHNDSERKNNRRDNESFIDYEFSLIPYEEFYRSRPPLLPGSGGVNPPGTSGAEIPPPGSGAGYNPGGSSGYNPSGNGLSPSMQPPTAPPNYIPSKNDKGVQSLSTAPGSPSAKAVSGNSISFCLYKFTYIWEINGKSYWTYLLNVDRVSISGFRWLGRYWVLFGIDLRKIDSFVCYRYDSTFNDENIDYRSKNYYIDTNKTEYSLTEIREVYIKSLDVLEIPEQMDDFIVETIGIVDDKNVEIKIPCVKTRLTSYRINLEVSYPEILDDEIKATIIQYAEESCSEIYKILNENLSRGNKSYLTPLEVFNKSINLINELLKIFSINFSQKLQKLPNYKELSRFINYKIIREKVTSKWIKK